MNVKSLCCGLLLVVVLGDAAPGVPLPEGTCPPAFLPDLPETGCLPGSAVNPCQPGSFCYAVTNTSGLCCQKDTNAPSCPGGSTPSLSMVKCAASDGATNTCEAGTFCFGATDNPGICCTPDAACPADTSTLPCGERLPCDFDACPSGQTCCPTNSCGLNCV